MFRLYIQPVAQSSARGRVSVGHANPALLRTSCVTFFMRVRTTTRRMNARVRNNIKFHEENVFLTCLVFVRRFVITFPPISKLPEVIVLRQVAFSHTSLYGTIFSL